VKYDIYIYLKDGEVTMWQKHYIWHKWLPKTPIGYAKDIFKITKKPKEFGPCWWGTQDEDPSTTGYQLVGVIKNEEK
jgi:hypothetical protein